VIVVGRWVSRFVPSYLIGVVLAAGVVGVMGWTGGEVPLIERIPPSLPGFEWPAVSWGMAERLFGGALALAIIGMLETVAIAKNIATHTGERVSANQEFFAQGVTNFASSFFQCIAGSGSFSRSALDHAAGAETRFAAVYNAGFVAAIFLLFGAWARYVPQAALAAVLFVIAYGLVEWRYFLRLARTSASDSVVCFVTFIATLVAPLEYAIFIGIFLNIGLYLRQASRLHLHEMIQSPGGPFVETPIHDRSGHKQILFLQVEGDLFFGVADELQDRLTGIARSGVRVVILRLKRTHSVDTTCLHVLEQFAKQMQDRGGHVILCGVRTDLMGVLKGYGLVQLLGRENVIGSGVGVFESAKQAIQRAKKLVQASVDTRRIEVEMEQEPSYEI
jgi:SulP family sulfate permease